MIQYMDMPINRRKYNENGQKMLFLLPQFPITEPYQVDKDCVKHGLTVTWRGGSFHPH